MEEYIFEKLVCRPSLVLTLLHNCQVQQQLQMGLKSLCSSTHWRHVTGCKGQSPNRALYTMLEGKLNN